MDVCGAVRRVLKCGGAGALASCAAPLVGLLAERWFGFSGAASRTDSAERDLTNARALGAALLCFCLVPWAGTLLVYSGAPGLHGIPFQPRIQQLQAIPVRGPWTSSSMSATS